ncbi:MAG: 1-deoxy-D-xylulose-5-phosphate synthase [Desulfobacteraceae bacterium]|nr:MAG: 1-deoxy-D-xylulose-5-phosphate synthase [Desulfobacteraceae bacterium]
MSLLDIIHSPADLKRLPRSALPKLALEIRKLIIETVSKNGGHLASNLGVVELTLALHYVFDLPKDKIVWDVGHQAYTHKILTGRKDRFPTIRQMGGISGFPKISESLYDAFTTGHSSTSISAGLGIACGKRLKNEPAKVIAVIGDGSMTAGLAFEGLNQAGDIHDDLIVILNDNELSIAPNVGALSSLLSRTFSATYLQNLRKDLGELIRSVPRIGQDAYHFAKRAEESFKTLVTSGMLFESFNFDYFGPIKGHRLNHLIDILTNIKILREPVLLHVTTQKGKGYEPAEQNPVYFHGVGKFEVETGGVKTTAGKPIVALPSYTEVFGEAMVALAQKDEKIIAVTAAMPEGTGLSKFAAAFPDRFFDVGIAEQHGVTFSAGLATEGFKPVVAIYSTFLQRAYDQILHDVCIESLPVSFAVDRGGIVGEDGYTHHGLFDLCYLRSLPNMVVMAPKDENELRRMILTAINHPGPIAFRYPRGTGLGVAMEAEITPIPIGKAEVVAKGDDILILGIGGTVAEAVKAGHELREQHQIHATIINSRFVKPLDAELIIEHVSRIPRIITVEENMRQGGFGSAVLELLNDAGLTGNGIQMTRLGIPDLFVEHGPQHLLREKYNIDAAGIVHAVRAMLSDKPHLSFL